VEVGLLFACVFFIYRMSTLFRVEPHESSTDEVHVVRLYGSLFFGAVAKLDPVGTSVGPNTQAVVLEAHRLISMDTSGLDALGQLHRSLERQGVRLMLCDLNEQPRSLIERSGFKDMIGAPNVFADLL